MPKNCNPFYQIWWGDVQGFLHVLCSQKGEPIRGKWHNFEMKLYLAQNIFKGVGSSAERGRMESERETAVCFFDTNVSTLQLWGWIMLNWNAFIRNVMRGLFIFLHWQFYQRDDFETSPGQALGNRETLLVACSSSLLLAFCLLTLWSMMGVIFLKRAVGAISFCGKMFSIGLFRARTSFTMKIHLNAIRAFQNNVFIEPYSSASRALRKRNENRICDLHKQFNKNSRLFHGFSFHFSTYSKSLENKQFIIITITVYFQFHPLFTTYNPYQFGCGVIHVDKSAIKCCWFPFVVLIVFGCFEASPPHWPSRSRGALPKGTALMMKAI